jgi:hypothetical protein
VSGEHLQGFFLDGDLISGKLLELGVGEHLLL